ncbi:MAG: rhomboid family intramembrane serine protease [Rudaea sp.]
MQSLPPVTRALLIVNVVVFALQQLGGDYIVAHYALWPLGDPQWLRMGNGNPVRVGFELWQLVTYGFLHGGFAHIGFNMFALWMFGGPVENALGARRYTFYYFVCVIGAACAQLTVIHFFKSGDFYPTLGASGGIFGLLLAFAMIYPSARIALLFFPVPIPAPIALIGYMAIELVLGITGTQEGVAHFAHLGGAAAGFVLLRFWRAQALRRH